MQTKTSRSFGEKLRERRNLLKMDHSALASKLDVPVALVASWESGAAVDLTLGQLSAIAAALGTSAGDLMPDAENDTDGGVRIQLPHEQTELTSVRGGDAYYVYHCLVRSRAAPSMVPLVLDVLVGDPDRAQFNSGHPAHEFIYVLEGEIVMKWGDTGAPRQATLPAGSSLYIEPNVPHTCTATRECGTARILSVNF